MTKPARQMLLAFYCISHEIPSTLGS